MLVCFCYEEGNVFSLVIARYNQNYFGDVISWCHGWKLDTVYRKLYAMYSFKFAVMGEPSCVCLSNEMIFLGPV